MATLKSIADTEWVAVFCALDLISQDLLLDELTKAHMIFPRKNGQG
jgi:hypothetical protein